MNSYYRVLVPRPVCTPPTGEPAMPQATDQRKTCEGKCGGAVSENTDDSASASKPVEYCTSVDSSTASAATNSGDEAAPLRPEVETAGKDVELVAISRTTIDAPVKSARSVSHIQRCTHKCCLETRNTRTRHRRPVSKQLRRSHDGCVPFPTPSLCPRFGILDFTGSS